MSTEQITSTRCPSCNASISSVTDSMCRQCGKSWDIYRLLASEVFKVSYDAVTQEQRAQAKRAIYWRLYQ
jgi:DNA polymerase I-like protein with 3'-5' exonuclease and polymerase domains